MKSSWSPGPWFNIKISSYQYRISHYGDKTILRPSYLHNGISYTGKMTSLYWIRALHSSVQWKAILSSWKWSVEMSGHLSMSHPGHTEWCAGHYMVDLWDNMMVARIGEWEDILVAKPLNDWVIFFKMWFHFLMLFTLCAMILYETGPIQWLFSQHCGYWWPGALAPGHQ